MSSVTFAEIASEIGTVWAEALRVFAKVQSPVEERTREEWEVLIEELKNKPTK
jgi:hypothetical protein